jgi:hypothetical protein
MDAALIEAANRRGSDRGGRLGLDQLDSGTTHIMRAPKSEVWS